MVIIPGTAHANYQQLGVNNYSLQQWPENYLIFFLRSWASSREARVRVWCWMTMPTDIQLLTVTPEIISVSLELRRCWYGNYELIYLQIISLSSEVSTEERMKSMELSYYFVAKILLINILYRPFFRFYLHRIKMTACPVPGHINLIKSSHGRATESQVQSGINIDINIMWFLLYYHTGGHN